MAKAAFGKKTTLCQQIEIEFREETRSATFGA
jgi:hypothetical protein